MKSVVRIEILGREYTIKSNEGEERVKKVAAYLNQKIKEITGATPAISTLNIAILVALNIANEYLDLLEKQKNLDKEVAAKAGRLTELIQEAIKEV